MKRLETEWQGQPLFQITLSSDQMRVDVLNLGGVYKGFLGRGRIITCVWAIQLLIHTSPTQGNWGQSLDDMPIASIRQRQ